MVNAGPGNHGVGFGVNEWLVEELYRQFARDPSHVDPAWRNVFADNGRAGQQAAIPRNEATAPTDGARTTPLRGVAARVAANMDSSLIVPTATSARAVPANLLLANRAVINDFLDGAGGQKVSVTHLVGYAMVKAVAACPDMNGAYAVTGGRPAVVTPEHVNLGLAVDIRRPDGTRTVVVPSVKSAELMDFPKFREACGAVVNRARTNTLTADDLSGTTVSLTNTGAIGTLHSVPRLMAGQGAVLALGVIARPSGYEGVSERTLARLAIGRTMTLSVTYDHRIIHGAPASRFLRMLHQLLLGEDEFYDGIFASLRVPCEPVRWESDAPPSSEHRATGTVRVTRLIDAYRSHGHLAADTDPLQAARRRHPDLDLHAYGLTLWDLDREFTVDNFAGRRSMTLQNILSVLRRSYCRRIGVEYMHIHDPEQRRWIQASVERRHNRPSHAERLRMLRRLTEAEAFEMFLHSRYAGQRRFSLEGGEAAVVLLDRLISCAADADLNAVALGMSHRGRLNMLSNIVGKPHGAVFAEFEDDVDPENPQGPGDVKYNLGAEGRFTAASGKRIALSLVPNPSHLEAVAPVLEGFTRGRQDALGTAFTVLPVLTHGDAAFAGQGVVAETLNMSQLRGFRTGGTIHLVINNQIGFTTSPDDARSALHPTGVARMVDAPVFHVNGDDPEACARVAQLAFEFRQAFHKAVVIDLVCYRRRGHNEGDDPSMTQPSMYRLIAAKRRVRELYADLLVGGGDLEGDEPKDLFDECWERLERAHAEARRNARNPLRPHDPAAPDAESGDPVSTAISDEAVTRVVDVQTQLPVGFTAHPRVMSQLQRRAQIVSGGPVDWAMAETLAFGSLLLDGVPVRLTGQDCRRGTFAHRHHIVVDAITGREYAPLSVLAPHQATYEIYDSMLSEFGAMGFEYGYSVGRPEALVVWEAQFGDFANGGQTIVDEFVAAGEKRWGQRSRITLLLPHGHEGRGPNHSSARVERFLQLCAEDNMTVAMPSSAASYFHLLRWHALGPADRPLVVFTPKSMLRLKAVAARVEELTGSGFGPVSGDAVLPPRAARRILLCSGKMYWHLAAARASKGITDTAIVRLERLYPIPHDELAAELARYPAATEVSWVQEEPANQGAWPFMGTHLPDRLGNRTLGRVSPPASASTAPGSAKRHEYVLDRTLNTAFTHGPAR